jgi:hypothetical protein
LYDHSQGDDQPFQLSAQAIPCPRVSEKEMQTTPESGGGALVVPPGSFTIYFTTCFIIPKLPV